MSSEPAKTTKDTKKAETQVTQGSSTFENQGTTDQANTQFQNTGPNALAAQYFPMLYGIGAQALQNNQGAVGPSQFIAAPTTGQRDAVSAMYAAAPTLGQGASPLTDIASKIASGYFLNPANDPTFQGSVNAAIDPVRRTLQEQILPGVINNAISAGGAGTGPGAYGGSATSIPLTMALHDFDTAATNATANMASASRAAGMNLIPQAAGIFNAADAARLASSQAMGQAGTAEQNLNQSVVNNKLQQYQFGQNQAWAGVDPFIKLLTAGGYTSGTGGGTQTGATTQGGLSSSAGSTNTNTNSTEVTTGPKPNMLAQILQGGLGAAGIAASLFGAPTGGISAISGLGSLLGGLGGGGANQSNTGQQQATVLDSSGLTAPSWMDFMKMNPAGFGGY